MALRKVAILLTLFIFGIIARAWGDPVKSINDAAIQLTLMKMDENKGSHAEKERYLQRNLLSGRKRARPNSEM